MTANTSLTTSPIMRWSGRVLSRQSDFHAPLFPVYLGLVAWGGLLLRDAPLRGLLLPWTAEI